MIRWGGEEFLLILPVRNQENLYKILESIRERVSKENMSTVGAITISIGVALHDYTQLIEETIKKADKNLYISKANGRNQVTIS